MDQQQQQQNNPIDQALQEYKQGLGNFTQKMPDIAKKYNAFTEACFAEGKLSQKEKQMIALGISVYSQDEYCIIYHAKGCLDQGCTEEEILETVGVTAAFGGGAAMSQAVTLVQECISELGGNNNQLQ
ncbi:carboxymuconolactone decarboxylase family protein [Halalkalibacter flavus]|jgi:AhpD family alkylhydroperoxidase|uniref:carboxymuconolactone decarboxylase family protein n=1 Tax=Halalkalibacter flavus TaxID=3090668 RepID=UPI002FC6C93E